MNDQQAGGRTWDKRSTRRDGEIRRRWVISQRRPVRNMAIALQQRQASLSAMVLEELRGRGQARTIAAADLGERLRRSGQPSAKRTSTSAETTTSIGFVRRAEV